jgi:aspartate/glutamate racemase
MSVKSTEVIVHRICDICEKEFPEKELATMLPESGRKADAVDVCQVDTKQPIAEVLAAFAKREKARTAGK